MEFARLERYDRLKTLFRIILAIPILILRYVMGLLLEIGAIAAWFVILITGKLPRGLFDLMVLGQLLHRALGRLPLPADRDLPPVPGRADPRCGDADHSPTITSSSPSSATRFGVPARAGLSIRAVKRTQSEDMERERACALPPAGACARWMTGACARHGASHARPRRAAHVPPGTTSAL